MDLDWRICCMGHTDEEQQTTMSRVPATHFPLAHNLPASCHLAYMMLVMCAGHRGVDSLVYLLILWFVSCLRAQRRRFFCVALRGWCAVSRCADGMKGGEVWEIKMGCYNIEEKRMHAHDPNPITSTKSPCLLRATNKMLNS